MTSPDAMPTPDAPTEELAAFDPHLAEAVAAVLAQAGVPTILDQAPGGERSVLVPPARRSEALATLASRMDEVQALAGGGAKAPPHGYSATASKFPATAVTSTGAAPPAEPSADGDGEARPLVLERFRSFGWVAVALVPLLVVALANVRLPAGVVVALVVGSVVLVHAWRSGRLGGQG